MGTYLRLQMPQASCWVAHSMLDKENPCHSAGYSWDGHTPTKSTFAAPCCLPIT